MLALVVGQRDAGRGGKRRRGGDGDPVWRSWRRAESLCPTAHLARKEEDGLGEEAANNCFFFLFVAWHEVRRRNYSVAEDGHHARAKELHETDAIPD